ncbi:putative adhesin [Aspergillus lucknowensis]|uniref:Adhesin n=1 Tax=Aspergillus lucknowensis TaxID=176173 RepID=A0ABR4M743_9EURO
MKTLTLITTLLFASASLVTANPHPPPKCGTCNPISGENGCDITTSCINTGTRFHCACRAGYKASKRNHDITKQFRLAKPGYEFLVFTPEYTECNTLCDNPYGAGPDLCAEVPLYDKCAV